MTVPQEPMGNPPLAVFSIEHAERGVQYCPECGEPFYEGSHAFCRAKARREEERRDYDEDEDADG
jgi:hypothetical protein